MMPMVKKVVIIDDEESVRNSLATIIRNYCDGFDVVGMASNAIEGLKRIREEHPDIVLLDVQMPEGTGFDMLDCMDSIGFAVIFVTAYDQYAIRALKYNAIDYLLKPVDIDDLRMALEQAQNRIPVPKGKSVRYQELVQEISSGVSPKLAVHHQSSIEYIETGKIIRMEAEGSYTRIFLEDGKVLIASRQLKYYEEILDEDCFLRIHNSHFINIRYVRKYVKQDGYSLLMKDGAHVPLAVRRREIFEQVMARYSR
jgi:two-component system, LytTR family, response regulator